MNEIKEITITNKVELEIEEYADLCNRAEIYDLIMVSNLIDDDTKKILIKHRYNRATPNELRKIFGLPALNIHASREINRYESSYRDFVKRIIDGEVPISKELRSFFEENDNDLDKIMEKLKSLEVSK